MSDSRVVIVTGATSGLGKAMALALLVAGHRVVAFGRTKETVDGFVAESERLHGAGRALGVAGSVRSVEDCTRVVQCTIERFGRIDGLVNNAGVHLPTTGRRPKFYELTVDDWFSIVDTHLNGAFRMTRAVVPYLLERGWGRIVNHETSYETMHRPGFTPYGAAKAGLEIATAAWALELSGTGVTVNAILPGGVANVARISADAFPDRTKLVQPEEMGPPMLWLMSEAADGFTGRRVTAHNWNPSASNEENAGRAISPAGWLTQRPTGTNGDRST